MESVSLSKDEIIIATEFGLDALDGNDIGVERKNKHKHTPLRPLDYTLGGTDELDNQLTNPSINQSLDQSINQVHHSGCTPIKARDARASVVGPAGRMMTSM